MTRSTHALAHFSEHLAGLIPRAGSEDFPALLVAMLKALVPCDDATIISYYGKDLPLVEYFELPSDGGPSTLDHYVNGAFLLDPFYLAARNGMFGVFTLKNIAPADFEISDYYKNWYLNCCYQDEVDYLIPVGPAGFINIALAKKQIGKQFVASELSILRDIQPAINELCRSHWVDISSRGTGVDFGVHLHTALECFGSSLLSPRQAEVIKLTLHGYSTKSLARNLSISTETVKQHRRMAYSKLDVGCQAELFYLFIDSVMSANNYDGGDPLVPYMQPRTTVAACL